MRALWLENGALRLRTDVPPPEPPAGEALVRVLRAGICNTDIELIRGYYPFCGVLGHEFVGRVERGAGQWPGKRVVGQINAACGRCASCRAGRRSHCPQRTVLGIVGRDGAFAEYLSLPIENLLEVPPEVSTDAATFVEPLAAALQIQQQVPIRPDDRALVVGDGKLGQLVARTLALTGCRVYATGRHEAKLRLLKPYGVAVAVDETPEGVDVAVDCTGQAGGFERARQALRPGGVLVMKSTYAGRLEVDASALVVDEITLVGSRCGPFAPALRLLQQGRVGVDDLVVARYGLDEGLAAFERARQKGVLKVLVDMEAAPS